jgi:argininosuccinate lyase
MKLSTLALAAALALSSIASPASAQTPARAKHDEFFWLGEINKASAVINTDEGLLDPALAPLVHDGIAKVMATSPAASGRPWSSPSSRC